MNLIETGRAIALTAILTGPINTNFQADLQKMLETPNDRFTIYTSVNSESLEQSGTVQIVVTSTIELRPIHENPKQPTKINNGNYGDLPKQTQMQERDSTLAPDLL